MAREDGRWDWLSHSGLPLNQELCELLDTNSERLQAHASDGVVVRLILKETVMTIACDCKCIFTYFFRLSFSFWGSGGGY